MGYFVIKDKPFGSSTLNNNLGAVMWILQQLVIHIHVDILDTYSITFDIFSSFFTLILSYGLYYRQLNNEHIGLIAIYHN